MPVRRGNVQEYNRNRQQTVIDGCLGLREPVAMFPRKMKATTYWGSSALILLALGQQGFAQQRCEDLMRLQLPGVEIVSVSLVPEGPLAMPEGSPTPGPQMIVPAHCAVSANARPTSDSEIGVAVWLPVSGWNGKYLQVGNGGWAGSIPVAGLAGSLRRGYAAAGTDNGHRGGSDAAWAIGHPEKLIDFGYRALHETRMVAQALVKALYGRELSRAYFIGCSDGGREALMVAQRFPEDFGGIIAGAPASNWTGLATGFVWNEQALLKDSASAIPPGKLGAIQKAALAACDALDGVKDGLVEDPRACEFDPSVLACQAGDGTDCLTAAQLEALAKIYSGPKNPRTGEQIFPGYPPGTENSSFGWDRWITPADPGTSLQAMFGNTYYGQAVFELPDWDFRTFDLERDLAIAEQKAGLIIDSLNPDLRTFRAHGGKLIQYHGWGDAAITAYSSIDYYESVSAFLNRYPDASGSAPGQIENFYRLLMVPGMGHCGGGFGATSFGQAGGGNPAFQSDPERDILAALERWVEEGVAPERLVASGTAPETPEQNMTRPLCPYPQTAHYKGSGDVYDAASFECRTPDQP